MNSTVNLICTRGASTARNINSNRLSVMNDVNISESLEAIKFPSKEKLKHAAVL